MLTLPFLGFAEGPPANDTNRQMPPYAYPVQVLVVGGGGGGGFGGAGGGGGGGVSYSPAVAVTAGVTYSVVVGAGERPWMEYTLILPEVSSTLFCTAR